MGKSAKERIVGFGRASKDRLSGRRSLISPKVNKKHEPKVIELVDQSGFNGDDDDAGAKATKTVRAAAEDNPDEDAGGNFSEDEVGEAGSDGNVGPGYKNAGGGGGKKVEFLSSSPIDSKRDVLMPRPENCCILMVGSTGTGKSSTIEKLSGQNVRTSSSIRRETQRCALYRPSPAHPDKNIFFDIPQQLFFVDTVGWDDAELEDEDSFKEILRFINDHNICNIKAVIWTVSPNIRQDKLLNSQAALINQFGDKRIWKRVIITCKQSTNPGVDTQGALAAALDYDPSFRNDQVLGYRFLNDTSLSMDQFLSLESDSGMRKTWNVMTDEEIRDAFRDAFDSAIEEDTLKVVFNDQRCRDCGAIGDPRLLPKFCHMRKTLVHKVRDPEVVHPEDLVSFHPEEIPIKTHPGRVDRAPWYRDVRRKRIYSCCSGSLTASGCVLKWKCCGQQHKLANKNPASSDASSGPSLGCRKKYPCCGAEVSLSGELPVGCETLFPCCGRNRNQNGCLAICVKCEKPWGREAGKCFIKPHNPTDILDDEDEDENVSAFGGRKKLTRPVILPADTLAKTENGVPRKINFLEKCELPRTVPLMII